MSKSYNQIYVDDCVNVIANLPNNAIKCTVTSPPYNKQEKGGIIVKKIIYDKFRDTLSESNYQAQQIEILNALYEKTCVGGSLFYNHRPRWEVGVAVHPFEWLAQTKWHMRQQIIWYRRFCGNLRPWRFYQTHEELWWLWKDNQKKPGQNAIPLPLAKHGSVWDLRPYSNKKEARHPCIFPPEIPSRCIMATTEENDLVFDPYCGSGTTMVAANVLKRKYLGCDVSADYVAAARQRVKKPFTNDVARIMNSAVK